MTLPSSDGDPAARRDGAAPLPAAVLAAYDLGPAAHIEQLNGTRNTNYVVHAGSTTLFVRRRHEKYSDPEWVAYDHAALLHLDSRGAPVLAPLKRPDGGTCFCYGGCCFEIFPFLESRCYRPENATQLTSAAAGIARFHQAGAGFRQQYEKTASPRAETCPQRLLAVIERLAAAQPALGSTLSFLQKQLYLAAERFSAECYADLPRTLNHGDLHPGNALFSDTRLLALVDVDWMGRRPALYDLAYALLFFTGHRDEIDGKPDIWTLSQPFDFDAEQIALFLAAYQDQVGVIPYDQLCLLPEQMRLTWLHCRLEGALKVPAHRWAEFLERDLAGPFLWLEKQRAWIAANPEVSGCR